MSTDISDSDTEQSSTLCKHLHKARHARWGGLTNAFPKAQGGGWRPRSMTAPVLISIALLALAIAAAIEILAQRSRSNGGLALVPPGIDIPQYAMLSYLYLPTIVAVIFNLIWNWVDLDVKRMQPWFELSKPEGATAKNSLFLDYPYEFIGFVPFKAAKRRHWPVFLSSTVVAAISWLVTPLLSSILGITIILNLERASLGTRSRLVSPEEQNSLINPQILIRGYLTQWLGEPYPPFTLGKYAILPFYVENVTSFSPYQSSWTVATTKLWTELECWPAEVHSPQTSIYSFYNGQGCNVTTNLTSSSRLHMQYSGYYPSKTRTPSLSDHEGCPPSGNVTHQFLALWSEQHRDSPDSVPSFNVTAIFCQPHYYKQEVFVEVWVDFASPNDKSIVELSSKERLTEKEFNSTAFEFLLANGYADQGLKQDYPFENVIDPILQMDKTDLSGPLSNMVGYALARKNEPADAYKDPKKLQAAFNRAHQYLFSSAVSFLLVNETDFSNRTVVSVWALRGIYVSRPISAAVEALLVVAAICILALLWACQNSTSLLQSNPSSISRHVQIFRNSQDLDQLFFPVDCADDKSLSQLFPDDRFRLSRNTVGGAQKLAIERIPKHTSSDGFPAPSDLPRGYYKPFRPVALRRVSGIVFLLIEVAAIITVSCLKLLETRQHGLKIPSHNQDVLLLLENYIPTSFATLTEPFVVLLNRLLCVLQPFKALSMGRSEASRSIDITYASIPPQFVIWRAIKRRHFLLAIACIVALLPNVLTVALSALFKEMYRFRTFPQEFRPTITDRFDDTFLGNYDFYLMNNLKLTKSYSDHMYIAMANISRETDTMPMRWTTSGYFFQPQTVVDEIESRFSMDYNVPARGYGVSPNCEPIAPFFLPEGESFTHDWDDCCALVNRTKQTLSNPKIREVTGPVAIETIQWGLSENCQTHIAFGWGRSTIHSTNEHGAVSGSGVVCKPIFQTAMFDVTYSDSGYVKKYERTSNITSTLDHAILKNQTDLIIKLFNSFFNISNDALAHNDTISLDWMNYLLVISMDSRVAIDPAKPPPDPEKMIPRIEYLYRSLFAAYLGLNPHFFEPANSSAVVKGSVVLYGKRIFMAGPAFIITVVILGLNVIVVVLFYSTALVSTLPRMPTSIGSILAYVASSRMVLGDQEENEEGIEDKKTYSFGRYIGVDNKSHIGIDMDPHVALIDPKSIKEKKPLLSALRLTRWNNEKADIRSSTWI